MGSLTLGGCVADASDDSTSAEQRAEVVPTGVASDALAGDITVLPDKLVVAHPETHRNVLKLAAGTIFVSKGIPGSNNPNGFLRKVVSVRAVEDTFEIATAKASLADIRELEDKLVEGEGAVPLVRGFDPGPNVKGKVLLSKSEVSIRGDTLSEQVIIEDGFIHFHPSVKTDLRIKNGKLSHFLLQATGQFDAKLILDIDLKGNLSGETIPLTAKKTIANLATIEMTQMVGFIPVWESVDVSVEVGCDFQLSGDVHVQTGVEVNVSVSAGAEFVDGRWKSLGGEPVFKVTPTFDAAVGGAFGAQCSITPTASLLVYDLVGPNLSIGPYVDLEMARNGSSTDFAIYPGIRADFGGEVDVFGHSFEFASLKIFNVESGRPLLASANPPAPHKD
jgi:hypothetical protein